MYSRVTKILFVIAVGLLLIKSGLSAAIYLWPKTEADNTGSSAAIELIRMTNAYRHELGLNELIINPRLTQAAVNKAKDLLSKQYFSHSSPDGRKFSDWVKDVNYAYFYVGENLAIDFSSPQEVFNAWINSPKHKQNIVRPEFQEIGIADLKGRYDGRETDVVVQLFGSRVLGTDELTTSTASLDLAKNYFAPAYAFVTAQDYINLLNQQINYFLFFFIFLLVFSLILRKIRQKKLLPHSATDPLEALRTIRVSAKKQAPPLISLYTKQTHSASGRSDTLKNTLPPDSQKSATTKSPKAK